MQINVMIPESDCKCTEQDQVEGEVAHIKVEGVEDVHPSLGAHGLFEPE